MFPPLRLISAMKLVGEKRCATNHKGAQHNQRMLKSEEEIKLHPSGISRLVFAAHAFDDQHQYLFHVTEHKMSLHQKGCFRKKIVEQA